MKISINAIKVLLLLGLLTACSSSEKSLEQLHPEMEEAIKKGVQYVEQSSLNPHDFVSLFLIDLLPKIYNTKLNIEGLDDFYLQYADFFTAEFYKLYDQYFLDKKSLIMPEFVDTTSMRKLLERQIDAPGNYKSLVYASMFCDQIGLPSNFFPALSFKEVEDDYYLASVSILLSSALRNGCLDVSNEKVDVFLDKIKKELEDRIELNMKAELTIGAILAAYNYIPKSVEIRPKWISYLLETQKSRGDWPATKDLTGMAATLLGVWVLEDLSKKIQERAI